MDITDKKHIITELKIHLQDHYGKSIKEVILFGSQSRINAPLDSDYDVLILLDMKYSYKDENLILDLCYDIDLKNNILIDAHLINTEELISLRAKQPIYTNALKSGIYA
jgi:uncharacterized protein